MDFKSFKEESVAAFEQSVIRERNENVFEEIKVGGHITDHYFCFIQNSREWMKEYLYQVAAMGNLANVNKQIAEYLRDEYGLKTNDVKVDYPFSFLIQGYHKLIPTHIEK